MPTMSLPRPLLTHRRNVEELEKRLKDTEEVLDHVLANAFKRKKKTELGEKPTKKTKKGN